MENAREILSRLVDGLRKQALAAERERTIIRTEVGQLTAANLHLREKLFSDVAKITGSLSTVMQQLEDDEKVLTSCRLEA